jgi:hypothetical protein
MSVSVERSSEYKLTSCAMMSCSECMGKSGGCNTACGAKEGDRLLIGAHVSEGLCCIRPWSAEFSCCFRANSLHDPARIYSCIAVT